MTQKAVTWDHFQRMFLASLAWGGRCPSLAPQPKKKFSYMHVMLCASIEVPFKILTVVEIAKSFTENSVATFYAVTYLGWSEYLRTALVFVPIHTTCGSGL